MEVETWRNKERGKNRDLRSWTLIVHRLDAQHPPTGQTCLSSRCKVDERLTTNWRMIHKGTILAVTVCLLVVTTVGQLSSKGGHCPLKNSISKCTPRCVTDYQCSMNEKCCPNKCGTESCADASPFSTGNGYKGSQNEGVYCAGVKCGPYEKCQFDRKTKREKCVRT